MLLWYDSSKQSTVDAKTFLIAFQSQHFWHPSYSRNGIGTGTGRVSRVLALPEAKVGSGLEPVHVRLRLRGLGLPIAAGRQTDGERPSPSLTKWSVGFAGMAMPKEAIGVQAKVEQLPCGSLFKTKRGGERNPPIQIRQLFNISFLLPWWRHDTIPISGVQ